MWFPVGRRPLLATIITLLIAGMAPLAAPALVFDNQTLTGTVDLPIDQDHSFLNTITLDDATVNVHGSLQNFLDPVTVAGTGKVHIHGPEGNWNDGSYNPLLTIDTGIEVHVEGGTLEIADVINRGTMQAFDGGAILIPYLRSDVLFVNEGDVRIESGSQLVIGNDLDNRGRIVVDNSTVVLGSWSFGTGEFSVADSTIHASGALSSLLAIDRVRSEITIRSLDLEGDTLSIADMDNMRWAVSTGLISNGTIQSEDGFELKIVANSTGYVGGAVFSKCCTQY